MKFLVEIPDGTRSMKTQDLQKSLRLSLEDAWCYLLFNLIIGASRVTCVEKEKS